MKLIDEVIEIVMIDMELPTGYRLKVKRYAEQAEMGILNFTHLSEVPKGLKYVWVDATAGLLKAILGPTDTVIGGERAPIVSAIQEGDTSVTFGGTESNVGLTESAALASVITSVSGQLVQYRRVKWG